MTNSKNDSNGINRRGFLPLLVRGLVLPLFSFGKAKPKQTVDEAEMQVLLRPDGTTVHVKKSVVERAEVVQKNLSNSSLKDWLKIK